LQFQVNPLLRFPPNTLPNVPNFVNMVEKFRIIAIYRKYGFSATITRQRRLSFSVVL
jgi:hypothetical protein